jgi:hypothetical protein
VAVGCALILTGCGAAAGVTQGTERSGKPQVVVVGDSITAYSSKQIHHALDPTYRVEVSAQLGKRIDQMLPALRTDLQEHPAAVIENLGTNDAIQNSHWGPNWNQMISMTKNIPCVVLTTINVLPDEMEAGKLRQVSVAAAINERIRKLAAMDPHQYQVVDWNGFVRSLTLGDFLHYLVPDLIHPAPGGSQWIATQDKAAMQRCRG